MKQRIASLALVVRTVEYRDNDVIATLVTEKVGKVAAMVRGGRRPSKKRCALEPLHTLWVEYEDAGGELVTLRESHIVVVRTQILVSLPSVDAAGLVLRWLRHLLPPRTAEPAAWCTVVDFLDTLNQVGSDPRVELAHAAMKLLRDIGYGLELSSCIRCGNPCPSHRPAHVDVAKGGLICSACGGGGQRVLDPALRNIAITLQAGGRASLSQEQAEEVIALADSAFTMHAGFTVSARQPNNARETSS